jgi:uncharacterized protein with PIN domain
MMTGTPSFAVEASLGRLATYLRLLGFDTTYQRGGDSTAFFRGVAADRIALFRTRRLRGLLLQKRWLFIWENDPETQVIAVLAALRLRPGDVQPFSRCTRCNRPVKTMTHADARGRVPDYTWQTQAHFSTCPQCGRVFWPGSHSRRFYDKINHWFKRSNINNYVD